MFSHTAKPRALGLASLLGLLPTMALASPPQGAWRGLVQQANSDVSIVVRFNAEAANVHFDEPFSCEVPARLLKSDDTATVYRFSVSTNGGRFCDGLTGHNLTLTPASNGHLKIAFDTARNTWRGELSPPAAPTP